MKNLVLIAAAASVLAACGTTGGSVQAQYKEAEAKREKLTEQSILKAPEWMTKLPKSSDHIFEVGTAVSTDFAMSDIKAKTIAYAKICTAAGGSIRSQTKVYHNDANGASNDNTELTARSMCPDVDITGVETVDTVHVAEGGRVRTYVLVSLPTTMNVLKSRRDAEKRKPEAFKELDEVTESAKKR